MRIAVLFRATVLAVCGLSLVAPASAPAATGCPGQPVAQVFAPWGDPAWYESVSDGGMETQQGAWTLNSGATFEPGNEPFFVRSATDQWSAKLKSGASAVSAPTCVSFGHPTLRLFVRGGNQPGSALQIAVEYTDLVGVRRSQQIAALGGDGSWGPTPTIPIIVNALSLVVPQQVQFRFTASGGNWVIDDVYADPYGKG